MDASLLFSDIETNKGTWSLGDDNTYSLEYDNNFSISKVNKKNGDKFTVTKKKKRGPKKMNESNKRIHTKNSLDNINKKMKTQYFSYIKTFFNVLMILFGINAKFEKIKNKYSKRQFEENNINTIADILSLNSIEYIKEGKNRNEDHNTLIVYNLLQNDNFKYILSEDYKIFFYKFYYKNRRIIDFRNEFKEYNINKIIELPSDIPVYKDFYDSQDKERVIKFLKKYFDIKPIFISR